MFILQNDALLRHVITTIIKKDSFWIHKIKHLIVWILKLIYTFKVHINECGGFSAGFCIRKDSSLDITLVKR